MKSDNRHLNLMVEDSYMIKGYFVLADIASKFPKDTSIQYVWDVASSAHRMFRLHSSKFPVNPEFTSLPIAIFKYDVNTGISIEWPTQEYAELINEALKDSTSKEIPKNKVAIELDETLAGIYKKQLKDAAMEILDMNDKKSAYKCAHEWFMHGRTASHKHCKKCGLIRENKVDKDE